MECKIRTKKNDVNSTTLSIVATHARKNGIGLFVLFDCYFWLHFNWTVKNFKKLLLQNIYDNYINGDLLSTIIIQRLRGITYDKSTK